MMLDDRRTLPASGGASKATATDEGPRVAAFHQRPTDKSRAAFE